MEAAMAPSKTVLNGKAEARPETRPEKSAARKSGLDFPRRFTDGKVHPFDAVEWELRVAQIGNEKGQTIFRQEDVEVPKPWSQTATNIVASKYFHGKLGTPEREKSARQLIGRVVDTITHWGEQGGYFASEAARDAFRDELTHLLVEQKMSFNSPVWFNVGVQPKPQCSACFINSVRDDMGSIMNLAKTEGMLFKWGSGTGTNFSSLRSSKEPLSGGGIASGPVSFMRGFDAFAGVIKSGGKTRRAAKMVILNIDHPDIVEFIECKMKEETKAHVLIEQGYDPAIDGEAYSSIFYQNANHSVRVTDEFMRAVEEDRDWWTRRVTDGQPAEKLRARELLQLIAESAWRCGDPGMQYDSTVNRWHTCKTTDRIYASNPCVTGDTLVATAEGWQRIDSLLGRSARIIGADGQAHRVSRIFPTGTKPVFRLTTRSGYEVRITGDHKVWTLERGDVAVRDLAPGERIALQGPGFGRAALSERLALAIGVAVGDGCLTRSHARGRTQEIVILSMAAEEAGVLQTIAGAVNEEKQLRRAVGISGHPGPVKVSASSSGSRLSFASQPVVDVFKQFAVLDQGSEGKRFTPALFELDKPSLAAVLRGLFTADGTVANYGDKSQYVSLDSVSLDLLRQVQLLLLGFGIKSKLYENRRGGATESVLPDGKGGTRAYPVKEVHSLRISRASRVLFEREIGFHPSSPKAAALRAMNDDFGVYRDEMNDEVAGIEALGEEPVFDLTEEATHHFVANGLVVHNCSEYMFLDDTACNLASLNLMKFLGPNGQFDAEGFRHAVDITITAQEILVDNASYPTPKIAENSHAFRPLGLGYANLGALLMSLGIPYDSDGGRDMCGAITALMTGEAYAQSARLAERMGAFAGYAENREPMLEVIRMHRDSLRPIKPENVQPALLRAAQESWDRALALGEKHGYRNAQVSVLAPTGTIGFMMDCDTTGIEPDLALVKYKKLVGGGVIKIVNNSVPQALMRLGYAPEQAAEIVAYIDRTGTIEGAPGLQPEHLPVFDCSLKPANGSRSISWRGHLRMMAAAQPFLSGAISKTINMPEESTVEDIMQAYVEAWKLGLKAVAIYRDNSKKSQPLSAAGETKKAAATQTAVPPAPAQQELFRAMREKLPAERSSITHKFNIGGHEGYLTVGKYDDGRPGEIFIKMAKEGSTLSGIMDGFALSVSIALQYGVPLKALVDKFIHTRFEPSGFTGNPEIPYAKSVLDYIARWLGGKFISPEYFVTNGAAENLSGSPAGGDSAVSTDTPPHGIPVAQIAAGLAQHSGSAPGARPLPHAPIDDAPTCSECGMLMTRNGGCYKCENCGSTSGCS
jgi:ribonucleoside-diphosphate reductase alpha chain